MKDCHTGKVGYFAYFSVKLPQKRIKYFIASNLLRIFMCDIEICPLKVIRQNWSNNVVWNWYKIVLFKFTSFLAFCICKFKVKELRWLHRALPSTPLNTSG